jgi:hypothetical protein
MAGTGAMVEAGKVTVVDIADAARMVYRLNFITIDADTLFMPVQLHIDMILCIQTRYLLTCQFIFPFICPCTTSFWALNTSPHSFTLFSLLTSLLFHIFQHYCFLSLVLYAYGAIC